MQDKTYTIIFLVCIDEYNKDLRKAKLLESEVEQKQGYYRIPSFLVIIMVRRSRQSGVA